jgi:2-oxoisovalerate dehydrogenase E1 component beta subunit
MTAVTYLEAIRQAMWEEMENDPRVFLLGQDVGTYGGPFRVTAGMLDRFGPERVIDTPISESAMVGAAIGAAILGMRPVVEMQFIDFISCAFNQIANFAGPNHYRWGQAVPLVIRGPAGGNVHGSAFHSQNPESYFQHTPGLKIVAPATVADAYGLLKAAIRDPNPVLVFEHKFLYRRIKEVLPGSDAVGRLGEARVVRPGDALTLVGYGSSTWLCLEAADELAKDGVQAEVVDLRTLVPYDEETVLRSVQKTGRALVVHEAPLTLGFGAEVAARLADAAFSWLDAPIRRVAYPDRPVPYARVLEKALLPDRDRVLAAARELLAY